jgi:hypothetical protein
LNVLKSPFMSARAGTDEDLGLLKTVESNLKFHVKINFCNFKYGDTRIKIYDRAGVSCF